MSNPSHHTVGEVEVPPVGAYDLDSCFKVQKSRPYASSGDEAGNNQKTADPRPPLYGASSAVRFDKNKFMGQVSPRTPGPGTYDADLSIGTGAHLVNNKPPRHNRKPSGAPVTNMALDSRFKDTSVQYSYLAKAKGSTAAEVGPGNYSTEGSMVTKSFNITMTS